MYALNQHLTLPHVTVELHYVANVYLRCIAEDFMIVRSAVTDLLLQTGFCLFSVYYLG